MDETKTQDLESRVQRLENLHIWGLGLVLVGIVVFLIMDKKKSSASSIGGSAEMGGAINNVNPNPNITA
jgi:hypothetical protein